MLVLTIIEAEHNCIEAGLGKRRTASSHAWLDEAVFKHLNITKATSPKTIVECIRIHYSEEVSYKVAQLTRLCLLHRCGTCGESGHNATTCRRPHQ